MKTLKITALCTSFFLLAFHTPDMSQTPATLPAAEAEYNFKHGERLTYKIYYNWNFVWLAAGEVSFKVFYEGKQFHFQAYGET